MLASLAMLRHPRWLAIAASLALALGLSGCGIKGPLKLPPPVDAAKAPGETPKPATRDTRTEPKL